MSATGVGTTTEPLAFVIIKLGRLLERRINRGHPDTELTASQLMVLDLLARSPGTSRADAARGVHVTPQAVGGLFAQLAGSGMVTSPERASGQPLQVSVTEAGGQALEAAIPEMDAMSALLLEAFRSDHRSFVDGALRHLLRSLEAGGPDTNGVDGRR
jgi:DNA-binding MarR family transcriptional regulator